MANNTLPTTHASSRSRVAQWRTPFIIGLLVLAAAALLLLPLSPWMPGGFTLLGERITGLNDLKHIATGTRVRINGVVTFVSPEQHFFYIQDSVAGLRVHVDPHVTLPAVGDHVDITAAVKARYDASVGRKSVTLADDLTIDTVQKGRLPRAHEQPLADLFDDAGTREAIRVQTSGIVRAVKRDGDRLLLELGDKGLRMPVAVRDGGELTRDMLLDSRVTVRGVVQSEYNPWEESFAVNNELGPLLQVARRVDIDIVERAPSGVPFAPSMRALLTDPKWVGRGHRVGLHAIVVRVDSPHVILAHSGGILVPIETPAASDFQPGDIVEAIGWPTPRRYTITLQRADVRRVPASIAHLAQDDELHSRLPVMTSIAAIRRLPADVAARAYPVDLTGVLTVIHAQSDCYFFQAGKEAIYVDASDQMLKDLRPGTRVRMRGLTWPGGFAPVVTHPRLEILGHGELPVPELVDPQLAPLGRYDAQWVQLEGMIRPMRKTRIGYVFNLMTPVGTVSTVMMNSDDESVVDRFTDVRVRVRGVFSTAFNSKRVLTGYRMFIDSPQYMETLDATGSHGGSIPLSEIDGLLQFSGSDESTRRVRVQGVVTMRSLDKVYLQDHGGTVRIENRDRSTQVGDFVEVVGYPTPTDNGPVLADASLRLLDRSRAIEPQLATPEDVLRGEMDNRLVVIEARLMNQVSAAAQQTLVLHDGYTTFNAQLNGGIPLSGLRDGSVLRVTGIADVQRQTAMMRTYNTYPVSFRLIMRSPQDVQVMQAAPWWNLRHAWPVLAILVLLICAAMLWVAALRRRVHAQTSEIDGQRAFLRQVIDMCPNYIFVKDREGRFALANRAIAEAYGRTPDDLVGKTDTQIGILESEAHTYMRDDIEVLESREEKVIAEESCTDGQGRQRWMHTVKRPILAEDGTATHVLGVSNDVTLHKQAERTLLRAREAAEAANQAKSEFLANMSHEIRTPLNGILGMSELCLDTELSREQREYVETVKLSADGLLNVINDVLDFSKIEAGKLALDPDEFDIRETLDAALKVLALRAHQKGLELICDVDAAVPQRVIADANRLRQVILNLVGNAIKFTEQGEVTLRARIASACGDSCDLQFSVVDTGIGVAPERREQIFNPFVQADSSTTRQYGGTGLGLTICSRLVTLMGGRIWMDSEVGRGSEFHFTTRVKRHEGAPQACDTSSLHDVRVLVVDDNASSRRVLAAMLKGWRMRPVEARDAAEALSILEQSAGGEGPIRVLLADMGMPVVDGLTLVERSRDSGIAAAAVVMLTSTRQSEELARCRQSDVGYVVKPVRSNELRDTLLRMLSAAVPMPTPRLPRVVETNGGLNVLVAEDNSVNQLVMQRFLMKRGHRVVLAANGQAAVDAVQREAFDIVFMDVQMPELDGFDATRAIRRHEVRIGMRTPIVALTAHAMSGDRERCLEAGMDGYMTKPVDPKELDEMLRLFGRREIGAA